jgi:hypothetical protein
MTKIKDYSTKYRLQWWWYSHGGKELVENVTVTVGFFIFIMSMWTFAAIMDPPGM